MGYLVVRYVQSGTEGERKCWRGDQLYGNSSGENDKSTLEGTKQVEQDTQHWASDAKVLQEGRQTLPPLERVTRRVVTSFDTIENKSRRQDEKEVEKEGKKRKRKIKSSITYMLGGGAQC